VLAGLRFDVSTWSAIKLEGRASYIVSTDELELTAAANWSFGL
jgi:hypothetical protein